jgi:hypothetical protein
MDDMAIVEIKAFFAIMLMGYEAELHSQAGVRWKLSVEHGRGTAPLDLLTCGTLIRRLIICWARMMD